MNIVNRIVDNISNRWKAGIARWARGNHSAVARGGKAHERLS